jgi:DNA-binding NtrC family response regulator
MKRVLVVDDDPHVAALAARWLEAAGYEVHTAASFSDAKPRIDEPLDLLVVDIRLREFNGLQLAAHARATHPGIRIVVVSGWTDPVLMKDAEAFGAVFLPKPFDETQLVEAARGT